MEYNTTKQQQQSLLLPPTDDEQKSLVPRIPDHCSAVVADDIAPIIGVDEFIKAFKVESKKLWSLAGPAIFTSIFQYSLNAVTQTFAGHIGTFELAAFSVENSVISGLCYGIMWGMGSALETLCGQAYGAGQIEMLGVYMQRSWVILLATSALLTLLYVFAYPVLLFLRQKEDISRAAAQYSLWMIPQLYAYALNFPISKFLQAQSKLTAMAWISAAALALHVFFSWLLMFRLRWGMAGGAAVLNGSWWFIVVAQLVYIFSGRCGRAWSVSWAAFRNLWGFARLSMASAVMLCLEVWYFTALILFAGYLKNAEVAVDALSTCININGWAVMLALGLNAAISVRVSNELGADHPRTAKFSMVVVVISALFLSIIITAILLIFNKQYPYLFSESPQVIEAIYQLTPLLACALLVNNVQPALSGVAIGIGRQALVAYMNITCYYIFGVPFGLLLGYGFNKGVQGILLGMITGAVVQTLCLFWMIYKTNWNKEASVAAERIKKWGGETNPKANNMEK